MHLNFSADLNGAHARAHVKCSPSKQESIERALTRVCVQLRVANWVNALGRVF